MSYILDALKKAERERGIAQVPTLSTVHDLHAVPRIRMWAVSGAFLICVAAALLFFLPSLRTIPSRNETRRVANQPEAERAGEPNPVGGGPSSIPQQESPAPPRPGPFHEISRHDVRAGLTSKAAPQAETAVNAPEAAPQRPGFVSRQGNNQPGILPPAEKAPLQPQPSPVIGSVDEGKPAPAAAPMKPLPLREAMAKMTLSILSFSEAKSERLVFINGKKYLEGEYVEGNYLLESITPEGAVLSYEGERGVLRPGLK